MSNKVNKAENEYKVEFARRLATSFFSMQMGVTFQTAYKKYAENNPVGDYWLSLADKIIADKTGQGILKKTNSNKKLH